MTLISSSTRMNRGRMALGFALLAACLVAWPSGASAQIVDLNGPPPAPTLRGVSPAGSTLHVTWDPVRADDLAGYRVGYRVAGSGAAYSFREAGKVTTLALTGGIDNGTGYEVVVRAVDATNNESADSAVGQATPRAFWLATGSNIKRLRERDAAAAAFAFNTPLSFTLTKAIDETATRDPRPLNPNYTPGPGPTLTYASYAKFAADVEHDLRPEIDTDSERRIKSWVQAVLYDPEAWALTPEREQANPNFYLEQFCRLAHEAALRPTRRLTCINLPSPDLGIRFKQERETKNDAYLRMGFAKSAARTADITGIQSQLLAYDLEEFERLVRSVAEQARAADANPNVSVIAEVTPVNNKQLLNLNELFSAYAGVRTNVAGMYLALPFDRGAEDPVQDAQREQRMDDFLNQVAATPFPDPPDTIIEGEPVVTFNTLTATFRASRGGTSFQCQVDRGAYVPCSSPYTTPGLGDGPHRLAVRARDAGGLLDGSGLIDARPDFRAFTLENFVPETTIDAGPAGPTNDTTPTFRFSANEPAKSFACRVDSVLEVDFVPCSSPVTTRALAEGPHVIEVRATDMADKTDATPARREFTVDLTVPDTTLAAGPTGLTGDSTPTFDLASTEGGVTYQCRVDSARVEDFFVCGSSTTLPPLADGAHTFEARAVDAAANADASPLRIDFTVDATAPVTRFTAKPARVTRSTSARFAFSVEDASAPNGRGLVRECRLDRADWAPCSSRVSLSALRPGLHTFRARARDQAGNFDAVGTARQWRVQTKPATLVEGPALWEFPFRPSRAGLFTVPDTLATCGLGNACSVSVVIRPSPRSGRRRAAIGGRSATIGPAAIAPVRALLSKSGLSTLRRSRQMLVRADISVRQGRKRPVKRTVRFTLVAPRR